MKKTLIAVVSTVLVCCCVFGGTLAWLMDSTQTVTNTFTVGDVNIKLTETIDGTLTDVSDTAAAANFKMIPGNDISKDPKISVTAESEACWLFVKVVETNNPTAYLDYSINSDWKIVPGQTNVYYIQVSAEDAKAGVTHSVLTGDKVTVKSTLTKDDLATAKSAVPAIAFTAYAVQQDNLTVAEAWAEASSLG